MKQIWLMISLWAGVAISGCKEAPTIYMPEPATQVSTQQGELIGFISETGAHVWRGVPFAADTSGENRWRAARPAPSWNGIKLAMDFSPACAQIATPFTPIESWTNWTLEGSEDCLKMDIYAPPNARGKNLPVMVWIHGGSNVSGASQLYVGDQLAVNEDVIIMSVQYRLGPLGWFSHPALAETAKVPEDAGANFGTLDLIAALSWVRDNAASFGGDPDNVTIFGESAGGHNVVSLLASPLAEGLFHRAIIQSGSFDSVTVEEAQGLTGSQPNPSLEVAKRLGGPEAFHTATLEEVFAAFELDDAGFMDLPRIIQDGVVLPDTPLRAAFASPENFNNVPIISGINRDEMKLFYIFDERLVETKFGKFMVARDQAFYDAAAEYSSRVWRIRSVDQPLAMMANGGHDDVYAYQFNWDEGGKFLWMDLSKLLGAAHSLEIPFVFNRYKLLGEADGLMFQKKTQETRDELSLAMGAYWAEFARTGDPSGAGGADWPTYGSQAAVLHLDSATDGGIKLVQQEDSFDRLIRDLEMDPRLSTEQRCEIAKGLIIWVPSLKDQMPDPSGCAR